MNVLVVTWGGGGASQPAIGLGRLLAERGHGVRIVAPTSFADRVAVAGCELRSFPPELEFDPSLGRAFEDQPSAAQNLFFGAGLPAVVGAEMAAEPPDIVVVDYLLRSVICGVEASQAPYAVLMHMAHHHHAVAVAEDAADWSQRWQYTQVNAYREDLGLDPLPVGPASLSVALAERAGAALVVMPPEFDGWPDPPPSVIHVGPIAEEAPGGGWATPWTVYDHRPLVVISMSTMYMRQEQLLRRVAIAVADIDVRVLVLTGPDLAPEEVAWPAGVHVRRYLPHGAVFPSAALIVTHGGMGTLMAAFTAGVPTLCIPLGRDQAANAQKAEVLGASRVLAADAGEAEIRAAVEAALASGDLRANARKLAAAISGYKAGARAVEALERFGVAAAK